MKTISGKRTGYESIAGHPDQGSADADDDHPGETIEPSLNELRRQAAERGDVEYFLGIIRTQAWSMISVGEILRYLMRAAEVRALSDPAGHAQELFSRMVGINSFLLLRAQIVVADRVVGRGPKPTTCGVADLSADVVERLLPRLVELQQATAGLLVAQAQAARLWGLARAKEPGGLRMAPRGHREPRAEAPDTKPGRPGRDQARGEDRGQSDDVVPIPKRSRRHG